MSEELPPDVNELRSLPNDAEIFRVANVLKRIAAGFEQGSEEEEALRDAAAASIVVCQLSKLREAFEKLKSSGSLTPAMREALRARGIDPDDPTLGDTELT